MKIEIKRKKTENVTNMWKLNNTLLDNRIIKEKKKIENILIQVKIEIKHMGCSKSNSKQEVHSNPCLH